VQGEISVHGLGVETVVDGGGVGDAVVGSVPWALTK